MKVITYREAKAAGLNRYFTGKLCKAGHALERYVRSRNCTCCRRIISDQARLAQRARAKEIYASNRQKVIAAAKIWAAENRESVLNSSREWRKRNPNKRRAWEHTRLARKAAAAGFYTEADVLMLIAEQHGRCANPHCRIDIADCSTVDHVVPLSRGGSNWPANLQLLCQPCNSAKSNRTMEEWQATLGRPHSQVSGGNLPVSENSLTG